MSNKIRWEVYDEWLKNGELKLRQIIDLVKEREDRQTDEFLKDLDKIRTFLAKKK